VRYISTRGSAPELGFEDVLLAGLAMDGGLYVPRSWPKLTQDEIAGLAGLPFAELAARIVEAFAGGCYPPAVLRDMTNKAFASFAHGAVTPIVQVAPNRFVLELFHGPTLAFKDVAMQLLAMLMDDTLRKRDARVTIVGATSGDTGGAAIEAFRGSDRVDIMILFPDGRVSDVQRRMMTTPGEGNVHAIAIDGTFDDCQARLKDMFNHHAFREQVRLAGVNSINWARIVVQVSYYFAAAVALGAPHRKVAFAVPTGNFGDIFAGYVARRMGLPIDRLVIATNANDILARTHATGAYRMRSVVPTSSPSMDIQISSNFERWLFEAAGRDAGTVRRLLDNLKQSGEFELGPLTAEMRHDFGAVSASEADVAEAIRTLQKSSGYLADPHTACALVALDRQTIPADVPQVLLATAHPAKFPDAMEKIAGSRPPLPARLAGLMSAPERYDRLPNDLQQLEKYIEAKSRAAGAPAGARA